MNGAPAPPHAHRQRGQRGKRARDRRIHRLLMKHWCCRALPNRGLRLRGKDGAPWGTGLDFPTGRAKAGRGEGAAQGMQAGMWLAVTAGRGQSGAVARLAGAQGCEGFGQAGAAALVCLADGQGASVPPHARTGFLMSQSSPMQFPSSCFPGSLMVRVREE